MNTRKKFITGAFVFGMTTIPALAQFPAYYDPIHVYGYTYGGIAFNSGGVSSNTSLGAPAEITITSYEDLGSGYHVLVKLDSSISLATGAAGDGTAYFDRQAYLGMQGPWGTVRIGKLYTPAFATLALTADPTQTYGLFAATNIADYYDVRLNNGIIYNTPGFNPWTDTGKGFYATVSHYMGDPGSSGGWSRNSQNGFNIGYTEVDKFALELSGNFKNTYVSDTNNVDETGWLTAASYMLGKTRLYFAYALNYTKDKITSVKIKNDTNLILGFATPIGHGRLSSSFVLVHDKTSAHSGAWQLGLGYDYFLSKRTWITLAGAYIHNQNPALPYKIYNDYAGTIANLSGAGTRSIAFGLSHTF